VVRRDLDVSTNSFNGIKSEAEVGLSSLNLRKVHSEIDTPGIVERRVDFNLDSDGNGRRVGPGLSGDLVGFDLVLVEWWSHGSECWSSTQRIRCTA
jgi:hypothetical protein